MRQVIPFTKEFLFKTSLSEITSISLEHSIINRDSSMVSGNFYVSGEYKVSDIAVTREKFSFDIPFDIEISNYDINTILVDIDNFYYEIINNDTLKVNIDLFIDGEEIKSEDKWDEKHDNEDVIENVREVVVPETVVNVENENEKVNKAMNDVSEEMFENNIENPSIEYKGVNTFTDISLDEEYITYYVYIVKEGDTIDTITTKYNTNRETIAIYNDIENIKKGDKIIIPGNR